MKVTDSVLDAIGHTPLIKLRKGVGRDGLRDLRQSGIH